MKYLILTSLYYAWICTYSLIIADNIYLDATYFVIEDAFGIILVYFLISGRVPETSLEAVAGLGIIFYKGLAIISEFLLFWGIFIPPNWWATFAISAFFINWLAWWILRKQ